MKTYLGIDTSAYTTSVALVSETGVVLADARKLLEVKPGERGLRQSEAFFQHVNALPERLKTALETANHPIPDAIAVSAAPREQEGSYMPVFQAGVRLAESLAAVLRIPLYPATHQDGHIMAGCLTHPDLLQKPFLTVHLSGGTTEILSCRFVSHSFQSELIGGTKDLSFGQLIDRVGVRLGLPFPAGKSLEALILEARDLKPCNFPKVRPEAWFNLSGLENKACGLLDTGNPPADVAAGLMDRLAQTLIDVIKAMDLDPEIRDILIIGGVASNLRLRSALETGLNELKSPLFARYATVDFSSDNAIGVALIARVRHQTTDGGGPFEAQTP
jgi:N6-L-threonylcarbamoyladenine synthase